MKNRLNLLTVCFGVRCPHRMAGGSGHRLIRASGGTIGRVRGGTLGVSCIALACLLSGTASAMTYFVSSETDLRNAITLANGDGDPSRRR
ncbi:exported hypothetical protein [Mesorhizobium sp. SOD10]|nr:exported hypothetical protein [Mesorhizobium sp. SOD10]